MHPALPHAWIGSIYCKRSQIIKEKKRSQTSLQMEFRSSADRARSASGARRASVLRAPSLALSCEYTSNSPQAHIFLHLLRALGCGYKEYIQSTLDYIVLDLFFAV